MPKKPAEPAMTRFPGEVVLLGVDYSGKTLLCRHLEKNCAVAPPAPPAKGKKKAAVAAAPEPPTLNTSTQPSIGTELLQLTHRGRGMPLREVGGSMQPLWQKYIANAAAVVFVADTSSAEGAGGAVVELCDVLRQTRGHCHVLLLLNKRDAISALPEDTVRLLFDLDALEAASDGELQVQWGSALTGDGVPAVLEWCFEALTTREEAEAEAHRLLAEAEELAAKNQAKSAAVNAEMEAAAAAKAAAAAMPAVAAAAEAASDSDGENGEDDAAAKRVPGPAAALAHDDDSRVLTQIAYTVAGSLL